MHTINPTAQIGPAVFIAFITNVPDISDGVLNLTFVMDIWPLLLLGQMIQLQPL